MSDISIPQAGWETRASLRSRLARSLLARLDWRFRCRKCSKPAGYSVSAAAYIADSAGPLCAEHFQMSADRRHVRF